MKKKKLRVEIIGDEDQVQTMLYFLRVVEYLCIVGASRTLKLSVDGDGAANIRVNFPDIKEEIKVEESFIDKSEIKFDIGY